MNKQICFFLLFYSSWQKNPKFIHFFWENLQPANLLTVLSDLYYLLFLIIKSKFQDFYVKGRFRLMDLKQNCAPELVQHLIIETYTPSPSTILCQLFQNHFDIQSSSSRNNQDHFQSHPCGQWSKIQNSISKLFGKTDVAVGNMMYQKSRPVCLVLEFEMSVHQKSTTNNVSKSQF